jgi:hypothetical protein
MVDRNQLREQMDVLGAAVIAKRQPGGVKLACFAPFAMTNVAQFAMALP